MADLLILLFLLAFGGILSISASPVSPQELYITPHADLPSPASLGITPAQLHSMAVNLTAHRFLSPRDTLSASYTDHCDGNMCNPAGRLATAGCIAYLHSIPDVPFTVNSTFQVLCEAAPGDSVEARSLVMGYAIVTDPRFQFYPVATSVARDIATGAERTLDQCYGCRGGICGVSGTAAAGGNGDFLVWVASEVSVEGRC